MIDYVVGVYALAAVCGLVVDHALGLLVAFHGTMLLWIFAYGAFYSAVARASAVEAVPEHAADSAAEAARRARGETAVYRRADVPAQADGRPSSPRSPRRRSLGEDASAAPSGAELHVRTLYDVFQHGLGRAPKAPCLGYRHVVDGRAREYVWRNYESVQKLFSRFGAGLLAATGPLDRGARVAVCSRNCLHWVVAAEACAAYDWVNVAIGDALPDAFRCGVLGNAAPVILCVEASLLAPMLRACATAPSVALVVVWEIGAGLSTDGGIGTNSTNSAVLEESISSSGSSAGESAPSGLERVVAEPAVRDALDELGSRAPRLLSFAAVVRLGQDAPVAHRPPLTADSLACIMFTSSTEGEPRGVQLSHSNVLATMFAVMEPSGRLLPTDSYLSYLPLSHILERVMLAYLLYTGARIGFFQGTVARLDDDLQYLAPTVFVSVPRVFERTRNVIVQMIDAAQRPLRDLMWLAYDAKRCAVPYGLPCPLADRLLAPFKRLLGGRVRLMLVGAAACSADCHSFIRVFFDCPVLQGYGMTESAAGACMTEYTDAFPYGNVGLPLRCCEIKLVSTDGYSAGPETLIPRGEIWISGRNVARGYLHTHEFSQRTFVPGGGGRVWLRTGDIGEYNPALQNFRVVGRSKEIFKLATGEYISPARLEAVYTASPLVTYVLVRLAPSHEQLSALVQLDAIGCFVWYDEHRELFPGLDFIRDDFTPGTVPARVRDSPQLQEALLESFQLLADSAGLTRRERIAAVTVCHVPWTVENGLLTPSQKILRLRIERKFA